MEYFHFFQAIWEDFVTQSLANELSIACTVTGFFIPQFVYIKNLLSQQKHSKLEIEDLHKDIAKLYCDKENLINENVALRAKLPDNWMLRFSKLRENANNHDAINVLQTGFDSISPSLKECTHELAFYYFNLTGEADLSHFADAKRFAEISVLLSPADKEAIVFLVELLAFEAVEHHNSGNEQIFELNFERIESILVQYKYPEIIEALYNLAKQYLEEGNYQLAEVVIVKVLAMCDRHLEQDSPATLATKSVYYLILGYSGHYREALDGFQDLRPDLVRVFGKDHYETLIALGNIATWTGYIGDLVQPCNCH